jgi:putative peptide maturation dehydrogenase
MLAILPEEVELLDLPRLFTGSLEVTARNRLVVASPLHGRTFEVSIAEVGALTSIASTRWTPLHAAVQGGSASRETLEGLIERELLLTDGPDDRARALREENERLSESGWDRFAALYHGMGRWQGQETSLIPEPSDPGDDIADGFATSMRLHGPPPPTFQAHADELGAVDLPSRGGAAGDGLETLLARRHTTRSFDPARSMRVEDLSQLLGSVFGHRGGLTVSPGVTLLKKSSPSGGALHPIEAYPLVRDVVGVAPGLYHYSVRSHRLVRLRHLDRPEVVDLGERLLARQYHLARAHVVIFLCARFERTFWKYWHHKKAYRVVLMDAAHLSQTAYLLCAEMELGLCFTAAINDADVNDELGMDGWREGVVGALACGAPGPEEPGLVLRPGPLSADEA